MPSRPITARVIFRYIIVCCILYIVSVFLLQMLSSEKRNDSPQLAWNLGKCGFGTSFGDVVFGRRSFLCCMSSVLFLGSQLASDAELCLWGLTKQPRYIGMFLGRNTLFRPDALDSIAASALLLLAFPRGHGIVYRLLWSRRREGKSHARGVICKSLMKMKLLLKLLLFLHKIRRCVHVEGLFSLVDVLLLLLLLGFGFAHGAQLQVVPIKYHACYPACTVP